MLVFVIVTVLLASANAKFYKDCGSKLATVNSVSVSDCAENAKECLLKRNTTVTIGIDFTPKADVTAVETVVHGIIMSLPVPFPLPQPDACAAGSNSGLTCPLKGGTGASYKASLPVHKSYPQTKVDVKWELQDSDAKDLVCIIIPAKIVD